MSELEKIAQEAAAAKKRAMDALNREESWIEKHPHAVNLITLGMFVLIVVLLAKSCA
jgi:hypothetical protein